MTLHPGLLTIAMLLLAPVLAGAQPMPVGAGDVQGETSALSAMTPAQVDDVTRRKGAIDVGGALQTVLSTSEAVTLPCGTYGVASEIVLSHRVHIHIPACVTIIQTTPPPGGANRAVIRATREASGSTIEGAGTIDGNRAALIGAYLATPTAVQTGNKSYTQRNEWNCLQADDVSDYVVAGLHLRNCMTHGFEHRSGSRIRYQDITVTDSTKVMNVQDTDQATLDAITGIDIGNEVGGRAIPFWQYAYEIRDLRHFRISHLALHGYAPLARDAQGVPIGDPYPGAFAFERMASGTIEDLAADGYRHASARATPAGWGVLADGITDVAIAHVASKGFYWPLEIDGAERSSVSGFVLDCDWNTAAVPGAAQSAALRVKGGGILPSVPGLSSAFDHWSMMPSRAFTIANGIGTRCFVGAQIMTGGVALSDSRFDGNRATGVLFWASEPHTDTYPHLAPLSVAGIVLSNVEANTNGQAGFQWNDGTEHTLVGVRADNNGQDVIADRVAPSFASGFTFAGPGPKERISLFAWMALDTQAFTRPRAVSFVPGRTDAADRLLATIASGEGLAIGQHVVIKNGTGSGDVDAKIMDIANDNYTLETAVPTTFSEAGNLTPLAGTVSVPEHGNVVTGIATAFAGAITGPVYLKVAGQYLRVGKVASDTTLLIEKPAGAAISGAPATLVQCDLAGVPSQRTGLFLPSGTRTQGLAWGPWGSYQATGNMEAETVVNDYAGLADGQEVLIEGAVTDLAKTAADTPLIPARAIPPQAVIEAYRATIVQPYGPADMRMTLGAVLDSKPNGAVIGTFAANVAGAAVGGPVPPGSGVGPGADRRTLTVRVSGGPPFPSRGQVKGDLLVRVLGLGPPGR